MEIETKAEAKQVSAMIEKWAETLPEKKARTRSIKAKKPANASRVRRSPKAVNGDVAAR